MSESVEQAALRRAAREEGLWEGRARREAAALIAEWPFLGPGRATITTRDEMISLLAIAWLQGVNLGSHETLASAEQAFDRLRDAL